VGWNDTAAPLFCTWLLGEFQLLSISKKIIGLVLIVSTLLSCSPVTYSSRIKPNETPDNTKAYIYGRTTLIRDSIASQSLDIGLVVGEVGTPNEVILRFIPARKNKINAVVSVVAVRPGLYEVKEISFARNTNNYQFSKVERQAIKDAKLTGVFQVEAGKAYYVGDYTGRTYSGIVEVNTVMQKRKITAIEDKFDEATSELKKTYSNLSEMQKWKITAIEDKFDEATSELKKTYSNLSEIEAQSVIRQN
jgi:hypothetical protein